MATHIHLRDIEKMEITKMFRSKFDMKGKPEYMRVIQVRTLDGETCYIHLTGASVAALLFDSEVAVDSARQKIAVETGSPSPQELGEVPKIAVVK